MPLMTEIKKRNGHCLELRWGWWHVEMMLAAARSCGHDLRSVFDWPPHPIVMEHDFSVCDPSDREVLTIKEGWTLEMWRSN